MTDLTRANKYEEENRIDKSEKPVFHVTPRSEEHTSELQSQR